jgi:dethiobiotin synthetase
MQNCELKSLSLFVTGTDTGIGKTVLALLLMQFLRERGENPLYLKLIQTGCESPRDVDSDARFIYEHVPALKGQDPRDAVACCFKNPKAPHFAARDEGKAIDLQMIQDFVEHKRSTRSPLILEGAGGLLVPVTDTILMIDLIAMLGARPVLAARAGLGTINHTLLSIEALRARGMEPFAIVFMDAGEQSTPREMIRENIEAVERFSGVRVAGVVGRISDFSSPATECTQPIRAMFGEEQGADP